MTDTFLTIPKPEDRAEWLQVRHPYFNASDAATLLGVHPYKSLADVVVEKMAAQPVALDTNDDMDRGQRLEPFLMQWFADKHGVEVLTPNVLYVCGRLMATLDGEAVEDPDMWVEAKTTRQRWEEPPPYVYWQVVAQAAASGKKRCHVVALDADMRFKEWVIEPSEDEIGDLLARVGKFWDHLDLGTVPAEAEFTTEHIVKLHPEHTPGAYVDVDDEGFQLVVEWEQLRQARVDAEAAEKEAKDRVARLIAENEGAMFDGRPIVTWKANKPSLKCDFKALEAEHPDLVASFKRETPGARVLRFVKGSDAA